MSALSHYQTLVNDMFDGAAEKVIFGFCISDCSGTGSNIDAQKAAAVMTALNDAYPCNGGAFFWVAEHDSSGSWSSTVGDVTFPNSGCSDETAPPSGPSNGKPSSNPSGQPSSMPSGAPSQSSQKPSSKPTTAPVVTTLPTPTGPGTFCCNFDTMDCAEGSEWCSANDVNCGVCSGHWMDPNSIPGNCIARWGECTYDIYDCCPSNVCIGDQWYKQYRENPSTAPETTPPDGTSHPNGQPSSMPSGAPIHPPDGTSHPNGQPSSMPSAAPIHLNARPLLVVYYIFIICACHRGHLESINK
jgi:hypothetical protein